MEEKKSQLDVLLALQGTTDKPGRKPKKLRSNFQEETTSVYERKYLKTATYFVDSRKTGNTIGSFTNLLKAIKFLEKVDGVLRPWQPSDEQMDEIQSKIRTEKAYAFTGPHRPLTESLMEKPRKPFSAT